MKKIIFITLFAFVMNAKAQITYEYTYYGTDSIGAATGGLQLANIGNNDYKYVYVDYVTNQLKLSNLNHTPYLTISIPVTLINPGAYNVGYVTKSLFDCDTNMIEYMIMPQANSSRNTYIYRQDGTLLFQRDSTMPPYCFGCFTGSYDVRPIRNTPAGAKLFLMKRSTNGNLPNVDVYALCGTLPEGAMELDATSASYVKVFPNPATGETYFQFDFPSNTEKYELNIYNSTGQVIKTIKIPTATEKYRLDDTPLSSGLYFFTLKTENKVLQNGKFIITK